MSATLVTGGCGMTGRAIVDRLLAQGRAVRSLDLEPHPDPRVASIVGDVRDAAAVARACSGVETIHHTVAVVTQHPHKARLLEEVNVNGTRTVLHAARDAGARRLVFTSSIDVVFSGAAIAGGDESLPYAARFLDDYARTKAAAERLVLEANGQGGMATVALRAAGIFGPGDRHRLPVVLRVVKKRRYVPIGPGTARFSHVYVDNVAHAHLLAGAQLHLEHPAAGKAYFVTDHAPSNFFHFVEPYLAAFGVRRPPVHLPFGVAWGLGAMVEGFYRVFGKGIGADPVMTRYTAAAVCRDFWFVHDRARRDLGYVPVVGEKEAFEKTLGWLRGLEG